ncbi:MAG: FtsX-like permease family protein [Clostridia bacterium]|nr:FtsX-like permease family protein [Clostridia bacterium]
MLKASGMSNKQFAKIFAYESLIYGEKSLLIGIILSYVLYCIIKTNLVIKNSIEKYNKNFKKEKIDKMYFLLLEIFIY